MLDANTTMSDALEPTLWHRMLYTPLRDAFRVRISGRLDIPRKLDIAALDTPIRDVIRDVLKRTRLWRLEKVDVADELIAHFADGIESGESVESLVEAFGVPHVAAKLIRRAVKRKRSLAPDHRRSHGRSLSKTHQRDDSLSQRQIHGSG